MRHPLQTKLIAHRAKLGKFFIEAENSPRMISACLDNNIDAEIDVWKIDTEFWLGHDGPTYRVDEKFLERPGLWIHAKNIEAMQAIGDKSNCFFHDSDHAVFTSKGFIWVYPNKPLPNDTSKCIMVIIESQKYTDLEKVKLRQCYGLCCDSLEKFKEIME